MHKAIVLKAQKLGLLEESEDDVLLSKTGKNIRQLKGKIEQIQNVLLNEVNVSFNHFPHSWKKNPEYFVIDYDKRVEKKANLVSKVPKIVVPEFHKLQVKPLNNDFRASTNITKKFEVTSNKGSRSSARLVPIKMNSTVTSSYIPEEKSINTKQVSKNFELIMKGQKRFND